MTKITQSYKEEEIIEDDDGEREDKVLTKITVHDDAVLLAALVDVGGRRTLRDLEDMDPMLEDLEVGYIAV